MLCYQRRLPPFTKTFMLSSMVTPFLQRDCVIHRKRSPIHAVHVLQGNDSFAELRFDLTQLLR